MLSSILNELIVDYSLYSKYFTKHVFPSNYKKSHILKFYRAVSVYAAIENRKHLVLPNDLI